MRLKEYLKILQKLYPADSDDPAVIVQQLACLAGARLSNKKLLPTSCGVGNNLDMDVINAGIVSGLEKLHRFDGDMGTLRAFLYPNIAGAIQHYAWKTQNRVSHAEWRAVINEVHSSDEYSGEEVHGDYGGYFPDIPAAMQQDSYELSTEEEETEAEEDNKRKDKASRVDTEDASILVRYYQENEDKQTIADSLGITLGSLYARVQRIKRDIAFEKDK